MSRATPDDPFKEIPHDEKAVRETAAKLVARLSDLVIEAKRGGEGDANVLVPPHPYDGKRDRAESTRDELKSALELIAKDSKHPEPEIESLRTQARKVLDWLERDAKAAASSERH